MDAVLVAEGVTKTYGETRALDDVSLSVDAGEVVALVGPNGAGKTTLVRALTGTTEPDSGAVRVRGESPASVDRHALGVLPQSFSPPDRLTPRELLRYYAGLYDDARDPESVLAEVGVADAADSRYGSLSGGQRRRVCLGAALVNDPSVVVLDEPTSGIDPAGRRTVRALIEELADGGATVLVTTHEMDEAERFADRVALLADGRLRATGSPADLVREHGGAPSLVVEEATPAAAAVDALEAAEFEVNRDGDTLRVVDVGPEAIADVVRALNDAGVTYEELTWQRPSLEDAYMALAGSDETGTSAVGDDAAGPGERSGAENRAGEAERAEEEARRATRGGDRA